MHADSMLLRAGRRTARTARAHVRVVAPPVLVVRSALTVACVRVLFRVKELATVAAAPACGAMLCDYGATVTKIEEPKGDIWRGNTMFKRDQKWGAYFDQENRGKRSVILDLKAPGGVDTLKLMLKDADVLITNVRSGPLERLGLDYSTLSKEMPHLVYAHLSAWGREGPDMNLPGYDVGAFFAAPGVSDFFRGSDQDALPRNLGAFGDHVTAIHLLSGIGLALFHKQRTGRGQLVDACLYRAAIFSAANWANVAHAEVQAAGPHTDNLNGMKSPREEAAAVALMSYKTSDNEWIQLLGLDHDVHVPRICGAVGLPEDTWARVRSREITGQQVVAQIDEIFKTKTKVPRMPACKIYPVRSFMTTAHPHILKRSNRWDTHIDIDMVPCQCMSCTPGRMGDNLSGA
jgi:crotonobetainyl-CoA:carnitine CoA-transferase CaiB-like acyl-CoA transferase